MSAHEIHTAPADGLRVKCMLCRATIRGGEEYFIEQWPNAGGFDYTHVECPKLDSMTSPERRVVQGRPTRRHP